MRTSLRLVGPILVLLAVAATPAAATVPRSHASALPPLSVSPTHVRPGKSFVVAGSACFPPPGTEAFFEVETHGQGGGFGGGGTGVPHGRWGIALKVPAHTPPGVLRITAQCDLATGKVQYPPSSVIVAPAHDPAVALSAHRVQAGGALTVRASGFFALGHLTITFPGVGLLAVATTDLGGAAVAAVHLPRDAPSGPANVVVAGRVSGRIAVIRLTVLAAPGPCSGTSCEPTPPSLADTGVPAATQARVGAGLLTLGMLLFAAGRRRRPVAARYFR